MQDWVLISKQIFIGRNGRADTTNGRNIKSKNKVAGKINIGSGVAVAKHGFGVQWKEY